MKRVIVVTGIIPKNPLKPQSARPDSPQHLTLSREQIHTVALFCFDIKYTPRAEHF